ncbi:MAG: cold shock domain-containing protein [Desulfobacteraceae bacterium]|nr:MAG: cold shock domain-containing protein [Desulfobacteraceae bacterium]
MAMGVVCIFHEDKGYGFIETNEGQRFFVHHSAIEMEGFRTLTRGDQVIFDIVDSKRGQEAAHVRKI